MECNFCGAPLNGDEHICSECGRPVEQPETADVPVEETVTAEEPVEAPLEEIVGEEVPAKQKNMGLIIALVACCAAILVLLALIVMGDGGKTETPEAAGEDAAVEQPADGTVQQGEAAEEAEPFVPSVSYVNDDAAAFDEALLAEVVAACGDSELTNGKLPYYYWREFFSFVNSYSSYVTYLMDVNSRLDQQESMSGGISWDEMFMSAALESYHTYAAAGSKARASGYALSASEREGLDNIAAEMESYASLYGYESADAYIQASFGPYTTVEGYQAFMEEYILGASYLESELAAMEITDDALIAYYEENQAAYDEAGLVRDDTLMIDIRHILIMPETVTLTEGEEGYEEAVQAAWDAAKAEAEAIYAQWQEDGMGEEAFAALAQEHSVDGSAAAGGLIEEVHPGQMVEPFENWCFEEGRQKGDHGIVETEFGYHIMYLSDFCEESYWHQTMMTEYENYLYTQLCTQIRGEYPLDMDLAKAAVYPVNVSMGEAQ